MASTPGADDNRLARMRKALDKFLELIDHKAECVEDGTVALTGSAHNFDLALPTMDPVAREKARLQLVQDLKHAVKAREDLEALIVRHDLGDRLAELQTLADEADNRQQRALPQGSSELKDVWRPDLDISTAIRARIAADQATRVPALEQQLSELQASNAESHARITAADDAAERATRDVDASLTLLGTLAQTLDVTDEQRVREKVDSLLSELGPV
ncbi:tyrosinase [Malassezia sp. CBS 17886]|nr:tyrosinase [Malassezia sp. CBS 17886]